MKQGKKKEKICVDLESSFLASVRANSHTEFSLSEGVKGWYNSLVTFVFQCMRQKIRIHFLVKQSVLIGLVKPSHCNQRPLLMTTTWAITIRCKKGINSVSILLLIVMVNIQDVHKHMIQ